jgi:hypothetical protein
VAVVLARFLEFPATASFACFALEEVLSHARKPVTLSGLLRLGLDLPALLLRMGPRELAAATHLLALVEFDPREQDPVHPWTVRRMLRRSRDTATHPAEIVHVRLPHTGGAAGDPGGSDDAAPVNVLHAGPLEAGSARRLRFERWVQPAVTRALAAVMAAHPREGPLSRYSVSVTPELDDNLTALLTAGDGVLAHRLLALLAAPEPSRAAKAAMEMAQRIQHGGPAAGALLQGLVGRDAMDADDGRQLGLVMQLLRQVRGGGRVGHSPFPPPPSPSPNANHLVPLAGTRRPAVGRCGRRRRGRGGGGGGRR